MPYVYITSLSEMPQQAKRLRPTHLISIIEPELQPPRPDEIDAERHLRIAVHDIDEPALGSIAAKYDDVERLINFLTEWASDHGSLLTHCYAGVSRSTAAALLALCLKTGALLESAHALAGAAPYARPNRRIMALADDVLGCGGRLITVCDALRPAALAETPGLAEVLIRERRAK